uniref:Uncharacterized protein n=1 Tax=Arundo donax TaxID=35708 RepID=A0A0A8XSC1_ARUDO
MLLGHLLTPRICILFYGIGNGWTMISYMFQDGCLHALFLNNLYWKFVFVVLSTFFC